MQLIKKFNSWLLEKKQTYDYGCAMLYFDFPEIKELHKDIDPEHVFKDPNDPSFGLEDEPHCTLLYGLHGDVTTEQVENVLNNFKFGECKAHNASLFENEKWDVLKFDIDGDSLHDCNKELCQLPHTTDFPDYHPHMTIAYLTPGQGKQYAEMFKDRIHEMVPKYAVYSKPDGSQVKIKVNIDQK
jgi:hypothetical protein